MKYLTQLWHHLTYGVDGKPSTLALWTSVAYATATFVVVKQTLDSTLSTELFLVYLGVVGGHTFAARAFSTYVNRRANSDLDPSLKEPKE